MTTFIKKEILQKNTKLHENSPEIICLFVGCLLGDSSATRARILNSTKLKNTVIRFGQSEKNLAYLKHIKEFLAIRNYTNNLPLQIKKTYDERTKKTYSFASFDTFAFKSLNELHTLFYRVATENDRSKGRGNERFIKIIPINIADYLTPQALAFWFMDDGGFHIYSGNVVIATNGFTKEDTERLQEALKQKFNLKVKLQKAGPLIEQYSLFFSKAETNKLRVLIQPFMVPTMYYKIGLDLDENLLPLKKKTINPLSVKPALRPGDSLLTFPEEILSLFVGSLLGGACVERNHKSSQVRFAFIEKKLTLAKFIHQNLVAGSFCAPTELKIFTKQNSKLTRFNTWSYEALNELHAFFYPNGKQKRLPHTIEDFLTPRALSYWVLAFGNFDKKILSTICITEVEALLLKELLHKKFNLNCNIKFRKPTSYRLQFSKQEWDFLLETIKDYLPN